MNITIPEVVKNVKPVQQFPSGSSKQEVWVETDVNQGYPQIHSIEFHKDKTALSEQLQPGQQVEISADLRGNEHQGRVYNQLIGYRVDNGV